jgi:hypothetical protein
MLFHIFLTLASLVTLVLAGVAVWDVLTHLDEIDPMDLVIEGFLTVCVLATGVMSLFGVWA